MITATHQSLLAETLKGMTELELESLLEEVAPHFKKERMIPILKRAFDFQGYQDDVEDLEGEIEDIANERDEYKETVENVGMLAISVNEHNTHAELYAVIEEIHQLTL